MSGWFYPHQWTPIILREGMTDNELRDGLVDPRMEHFSLLSGHEREQARLTVIRIRSFLALAWVFDDALQTTIPLGTLGNGLERAVSRIIHLPALRGNPRRTYRTAAVEGRYPGTFEAYTAGVISAWQNRAKTEKLTQLNADLRELGLTWKVQARKLDDTQVELLVGRLPHARRGGPRDLVNIADVGFGVSQTLPVVVALLTADEGQLVYLEQPEIHLHPRAQVAFARLVKRAVDRGVRVIVETHSSLLT
jgi:hypothetical protein